MSFSTLYNTAVQQWNSFDSTGLVVAYEELVNQGYHFMNVAFGNFHINPIILNSVAVLVGLVCLFFGASVFRALLTVPGFALGLFVANHLIDAIPHYKYITMTPMLETCLLILLPVVTALFFHYYTSVAIRTGGAVLASYYAELFTPASLPLYAQYGCYAVAGLVGSVLAPSLFTIILVPVTAVFGAFAITWAATAQDGAIVLGLSLVGASIQFARLATSKKSRKQKQH